MHNAKRRNTFITLYTLPAFLIFLSFSGLTARSNEGSEKPFLWNGTPIEGYEGPNSEALHMRYDPALGKYSTLSDCPTKKVSNGTDTLDWKQYNTIAEVEVCLFYLLNSLENLSALKNWAETVGFKEWEDVPNLRNGIDQATVYWFDNGQNLLPQTQSYISKLIDDRTYSLHLTYHAEHKLQWLRLEIASPNWL